jgi:hypothetical protein
MSTTPAFQNAAYLLAGTNCTFIQAAVYNTFRAPWPDADRSSPIGQMRELWITEFSERWEDDVNEFLQECQQDGISDGYDLANAWLQSEVRNDMVNYCSRYLTHGEAF